MISSFLSFELWQQLLIGGLMFIGVTMWAWGVKTAIKEYKENKNLKDCSYCGGTGKLKQNRVC